MHALFLSICALTLVATIAKPLGQVNEDPQDLFDPISLDALYFNSALSGSSDQNIFSLDSIEGTHSPVYPNFFIYLETL